MAAFNCGHFFIFIYIHIIYLMKTINTYISEKLRLTAKQQYTCQPKDTNELRKIILQRIKDEGNDCDLNDIDTSKITDMSRLFDADSNDIFKKFNGNISMWNVSNVKNMYEMFFRCANFNCDISGWNVSNVKYMNDMFYGCKKFDCDLSTWNVSNVEYMGFIFYGCSKFNCDLSNWDVSNVKNMVLAFFDCPTRPEWYK